MDKHNVKGFLEFVYDFYRSMKAHEITLVYEGEITHQITKAFTSLTESNMAKEDESDTVQKKVFHVMVECLQNISKHADTFGSDDYLFAGRGIFMVSKGNEDYHVTTGNVIENRKIDELTDMLEEINTLDKEGLKQLYKKQMREGRLSDKGGAGLGFIDIVRKTGNKLEYHFLPIDETNSFFLLSSSVSRINE
ncbi:MAG: SiaB family protein kinase [Bacteroidales bacterium]|nr:SiaB family protein kinase [Bacteroidales bacterium]MBS3775517.1 SiaB family protein kinase [Bacteroidales bacterium]